MIKEMSERSGNDAKQFWLSAVFSLHFSALKPIWLRTLILSCCQFQSMLKAISPSSSTLEGQPPSFLHKYQYLCYSFKNEWCFIHRKRRLFPSMLWTLKAVRCGFSASQWDYQPFSQAAGQKISRAVSQSANRPLTHTITDSLLMNKSGQPVVYQYVSLPASQPIWKAWLTAALQETQSVHAVQL